MSPTVFSARPFLGSRLLAIRLSFPRADQTHFHLGVEQRRLRNTLRMCSAKSQNRIKFIIINRSDALLNRLEKLDRDVSEFTFQLCVSLTTEVILDFRRTLVSQQVVNRQKISAEKRYRPLLSTLTLVG